MITDTKPLSERLRAEADEQASGWPSPRRVVADRLWEAADALDAKDALLREAREFMRQFHRAAAEDKSIVSSPDYESDDVAWFTDEARTLLSKLTEATKP